jgi:SAM-dependent methyltransferase
MALNARKIVVRLKSVVPPSVFAFLKTCYYGKFGLSKRRPYANDYAYQSAYMKHVPENGIILDLASGHNPFPKATILSDRYLEITKHRRQEITLDHRPFVILDLHHLPFKAKSIDYIYCSHVIEHVENPEQACSELMRVGKAGYIETPTLMKDALFSWAKDLGHKWYLVGFGNRLVFFEYDRRRVEGVRSTIWERTVLGDYYHPNQDLFYPNQDLFNTIFEWQERFDITVFRLAQPQPISLS